MKVLVADKFEKAGLDGLAGLGCEVIYRPDLSPETLPAALQETGATLLVVRSTKVPAAAIKAGAGSLKGIIRAGAGTDNIETPAATASNIAVANCPGMNAIAVAELTMGLLLACDRRIVDQTDEIRRGKWNKKEYAKARGLKGSTLGVVGLGAIGEAVVKRAKAFEMKVAGWSRSLTTARASEYGIEFGGCDRDELLRMVGICDAVSVHVAATADTKHLCDAAFFGAMRPGSYFINTSRGSVVDEAALRSAVREKGIRAALDVYENQPGTPEAEFSSETVGLAGVYGTHHCGASTDQAQNAVAEETVRLVRVFRDTGRLENRVN